MHASGSTKNGNTSKPWRGIPVPEGRHWRTDPAEFDRLDSIGMIEWSCNGNPRIKKYAYEHKGKKNKIYGDLKILKHHYIQLKKTVK